MMWRVPIAAEGSPLDGAQLLWSLLRSIESLPALFTNPLRPAMPASPRVGEEGDQVPTLCTGEPRHA